MTHVKKKMKCETLKGTFTAFGEFVSTEAITNYRCEGSGVNPVHGEHV